MQIKELDNMFYIEDDYQGKVGEINFHEDENFIIVSRTYVDASLRGQGLAFKLVEKVIEKARKEKKKIIPRCPYVKRVLEKNEEYKDIY